MLKDAEVKFSEQCIPLPFLGNMYIVIDTNAVCNSETTHCVSLTLHSGTFNLWEGLKCP